MKNLLMIVTAVFCFTNNSLPVTKHERSTEELVAKTKKRGGLLQAEQQKIDERFSFDFYKFDSYTNSKRNNASIIDFFSEIKEVYVEAFSEPTIREKEGKTKQEIEKIKQEKQNLKSDSWDQTYCLSPFAPEVRKLSRRSPFHLHVIRDYQENEKPVAFVFFFQLSPTNKNIMLLDKVAVHPSYQRKGLGRKLVFSIFKHLEHVNKICLHIKIETLNNGEKVHNQEAVNFYKRLGFIESNKFCNYELDRSKIVGG